MNCQKHLFTLPDDHHYLNCAYFSPLLKSVEEAGIRGIREKRAPWTVTPEHFFRDSDRLRSLFARLVNAGEKEQIAIMPSASYGLSTVANNLPNNRGDEIIVVGEQFPSNIYPWMRYCKEQGCTITTITAPDRTEARGQEWNRQILDAVSDRTLMVAMAHIHWTDGTLFDLEVIGERAHRHDALLVIDGTQSVGALPFDVQAIRPDALICAGYKWLMGPYTVALGYFGEAFADGIPLEEGWLNRKNSEDFAGLVNYQEEYQPGAIRYDVGERSNFIGVPMMIKALEQLLDWTPAGIQRYCRELTGGINDRLAPMGFRLEDEEWRAHHLFGLRMPEGLNRNELQERLSKQNIHVSVRGSAVRVSPHVYNNRRDLEALTDVLTSLGGS